MLFSSDDTQLKGTFGCGMLEGMPDFYNSIPFQAPPPTTQLPPRFPFTAANMDGVGKPGQQPESTENQGLYTVYPFNCIRSENVILRGTKQASVCQLECCHRNFVWLLVTSHLEIILSGA